MEGWTRDCEGEPAGMGGSAVTARRVTVLFIVVVVYLFIGLFITLCMRLRVSKDAVSVSSEPSVCRVLCVCV